MINILLVTVGPWQSVMSCALLAAYANDASIEVITFLTESEKDLERFCVDLHKKYGHTILGNIDRNKILGERDVEVLLAKLSTHAAPNYKILVPGLGNKNLRSFVGRLGGEIWLYEDGLHACSKKFMYGPESVARLNVWPRRVAQYIIYQLKKWFGVQQEPKLLHRIKRVFRFLEQEEDLRGKWRVFKIEKVHLQGVLYGVRSLENVQFEDNGLPKILVLGGNLSGLGVVQPSVEYVPIVKFANFVKGSIEVWWKPHPRADEIFTDYLLSKCPHIKIWPSHCWNVPVEALVPLAKIQMIVSQMSSSLLYSKAIWGVDCFRLQGLDDNWKTERAIELWQVYQLLKKSVPEFANDSILKIEGNLNAD